MEKREALYAVDRLHQKGKWTLSKWLKSVSEIQEKVALISEQRSQEEKTDQCLIQGEENGKPLL